MHERHMLYSPEEPAGGGSGAGGTGGDGGAGADPPAPPAEPPVGDPTPPGGGGDEGSEEVAKLRREAAGYRTQLRDAQAKIKEFEAASQTDLEKEQTKVKDLEAQIAEMEGRVRKSTVAVLAADVGIIPDARSDVAGMIDWENVDSADEKAVSKALRDLVKEKPYLLGSVAGGADGGAGGGRGSSTQSMTDRIRAAAGRR